MSDEVATRSKRKLKAKGLALLVVIVVLLGGGAALYVKYNNLKKQNALLSNPQEAAKVEAEKLKTEVGKLIELPPNEAPTIATVVDASKLKEQAFFANAQNNDRVLMFPQAKVAVLYRPSTKKIINVAPINIGSSTTPAPATAPKDTNKR